jgi:mono/diheme cytochrome c family protein
MATHVRIAAASLALACLFSLAGCGDDAGPGPGGASAGATPPPTPPIATAGEALYVEPHDDGNSFSCQTCHALSEPASDGVRRAGHPLGDAARRATFKNGRLTDLLDAVNSCRVEWMAAPPLEARDPRWSQLRDFLADQAPERDAPPVSFAIVAPPADLSGGDPAAGRALFDTSCSVCHGTGASGTERGPSLDGDLLTADLIGRRVRTSGTEGSPVYDGLTGGRMPFWSAERLSDDELRDLVAFLLDNDPETAPPPPPPGGGPMRACASTHPKVGQTTELSRRAHGVSGKARVVDDCTIELTEFTYDGGGIDVRFYGGLGGDYDNGFSMSEADQRRDTPYAGETVYAQLPAGRTLDDLDGISVWCVAVGFSFGDGRFGP